MSRVGWHWCYLKVLSRFKTECFEDEWFLQRFVVFYNFIMMLYVFSETLKKSCIMSCCRLTKCFICISTVDNWEDQWAVVLHHDNARAHTELHGKMERYWTESSSVFPVQPGSCAVKLSSVWSLQNYLMRIYFQQKIAKISCHHLSPRNYWSSTVMELNCHQKNGRKCSVKITWIEHI